VVLRRHLDRRHNVGERGEMENPIDVLEQRHDAGAVADIRLTNSQVRIGRCVRQIGRATGRIIVDYGYAHSQRQEALDEMTANKARAASDEAMHR
jgi:hypothetical protein